MTRRIFIIRHGNTFAPGEPPRRIGSRTDLPLVASGRAQARALGDTLAVAGVHPVAVHASPLARAAESAALICSVLPGAPLVSTAEWLSEIDYGPDEGMPESAVIDRVGAEALAAWSEIAEPPPGWQVDPAERIAAWRRFFATAGDGDHLCITSNGAARFALLADPALAGTELTLRTGAAGLILLEPERPPHLAFWNARPGDPAWMAVGN